MIKKYPTFDKFINKIISRKLTVFIIASGFAIYKIISGTEWVYVALMYIGTQSALDGAAAFINARQNKRANTPLNYADDSKGEPTDGADGPPE